MDLYGGKDLCCQDIFFNTFGAGNYLFSGPFNRIKGLQYRNYSLKYKGVEYKQIHINKHSSLNIIYNKWSGSASDYFKEQTAV